MDADHVWTPVVTATDCTPCPGCGDAVCPRCGDHFAECPCPGPHQDDQFYYRQRDGRLEAISRDAEIDDEADVFPGDDFEGPESDDEDSDFEESLLDRIEPGDWDDGFEPADPYFDMGGEG